MQKKLAKKKKGSSNKAKFQNRITKAYKRLFRIRDNWCHQTSTEIAKNHSYAFMEDLSIANMTKSASGTLEKPGKNVAAKSGLNKSILRQGWGKFKDYLNYKLLWRGNKLALVPAPYTSQKCNICKHIDEKNRQGESFKCLNCGFECDADINAALNILFDGLEKSKAAGLAVTVCGDTGNGWVDEAGTNKLACLVL